MTASASFPDCDVIIVNFNAGTLMSDGVSSAFACGAGRVIVVDNGSTDGSLEHLEHTIGHHNLSVIRSGRNQGFAAACNIGACASSARRLLFLNPDCVLTPNALTRMYEALEHSETIGMVGGLLCNPDGSEQAGGRRSFPSLKKAFMRAFGFSRLARFLPGVFSDFLLYRDPLPLEPVPVDAVSGACMLVKREAIADVGPWDEEYFLHCEDLDWCMRFRRKGWDILFVPDARIIHHQGACSRSRPLFVEWHKHRGMMRFYRKFYRHRHPGALWPLIAFGVWLRFILVAGYYGVRHLCAKTGEITWLRAG